MQLEVRPLLSGDVYKRQHLSHMTTKCGRANRAALVAYGFETGLLRRR